MLQHDEKTKYFIIFKHIPLTCIAYVSPLCPTCNSTPYKSTHGAKKFLDIEWLKIADTHLQVIHQAL